MSLKNLPLVAGVFCLIFGIYFIETQVKRIINRKPGTQSFNFRLMLYGVIFIALGVMLILRRF
jgi:hypothetical protein